MMKMHKCKLFFFVGVFGKNSPPPTKANPGMTPWIHVVWNMGWQAATTGAASAKKKVDLDLVAHGNFKQGFISKDLIIDIFELHPSVQDEAQALAEYQKNTFNWKDTALAVSLHSIEVGLTNDDDPAAFCTIHP